MAAESIGRVKSGSGKSVEVYWNASNKEVYVGWAGKSLVGNASSAADAMRKAEAWLYNK